MKPVIIIAALAASAAAPAGARVISSSPAGFEVADRVVIAAPPAKLYAALIDIGRWWSGSHTYSGDAANLSIDARAGGCWCERLADGGAIEHLRLVYVRPGQALRGQGGLGPLQSEGAAGSFTWTIKPAKDGGSELTQSYVVGGYVRGGAEKLAPLVDQVLGEQLGRLKAFVETGAAPAAKTR
jgi:uncharacterized protein YndB with AHSA1/START domain